MEPVLKSGDKGAAVRRLTDLLLARGFLAAAGDRFDAGVRSAVKNFQAHHVDRRGHPLVADGVVGPLTWWALATPDITAVIGAPAMPDLTLPPGGSTAGRAALQAALNEMAAGAREVGADNAGPWVEKYLNRIIPPPADWCAGFVSYCYGAAPGGIPFPYTLGARRIREHFKARGWIYDPAGTLPEPGDIVVWWREQPDGWKGHIGLVHHHAGGILHTIEGNKGGFPAPVRRFDYVLGRIDRLLGFGRVP